MLWVSGKKVGGVEVRGRYITICYYFISVIFKVNYFIFYIGVVYF